MWGWGEGGWGKGGGGRGEETDGRRVVDANGIRVRVGCNTRRYMHTVWQHGRSWCCWVFVACGMFYGERDNLWWMMLRVACIHFGSDAWGISAACCRAGCFILMLEDDICRIVCHTCR